MLDDQQRDHHRSLGSLRAGRRSQAIEPIPVNVHRHLGSLPDSFDSVLTLQGDAFDVGDKTTELPPPNSVPFWRCVKLPSSLQWIPANWSWSKWKPVLRSALAGWISLLLFLIPSTLDVMGQSAFLIILDSFLAPPSEPFFLVLQRQLGIVIFAASGWAWSCLGIKLADVARSTRNSTASFDDIITGQYLEPMPTVIMAVFLFFGSFFFMYIRKHLPSGPVTFAYLFSCMLCMDMSLTIAALYPYPYYMIGGNVVLPLLFHSIVSLVLSLCFFPTSGSATFTMRLQGVISSLVTATKQHRQCLQQDVTAPGFTASTIVTSVSKAEGGLAVLSSAAWLQKFDIIYSRFAPTDYAQLHSFTRGLVMKAAGMNGYYTLIDPKGGGCSCITVPSIPTTPALASRSPSRPSTPYRDQERVNDDGTQKLPFQRHLHTASHPRRRHWQPNYFSSPHSSLLQLALSRTAGAESAVGVFECLHHPDLAVTHPHQPDSQLDVARANELLSYSCQDLLKSCEQGLEGARDWLGSVRAHRYDFWVSRDEHARIRMDWIKKYGDLHRELSVALNEFTTHKRFAVLDPYRDLFTSLDDLAMERAIPSHRHLFHCYVYQYHLMRYATAILDMLGEIIHLETKRRTPKVWFPKIQWYWSTWEPPEMMESDEDENPDMIPGMEPTSTTDLGQAVRRDPDALPPRNALERTGTWMYHTAKMLGGGNVLFALKSAILTILLSLPSYFAPSAAFAYNNKFAWAVVMAQLTGSRFRGDTTFGLITRIFSTFVGGIIAVVVWYISTGSGKGNPYTLAAVCFVCFPIFFFFRLYWPVAPMTNLFIWVTAALVLGYSYEDTHLNLESTPGYGIEVAWKRFVLVVCGVVATGIFSFFPPATTIRLYQRTTLATTAANLGSVYCSVISFANTKREGEPTVIVRHLLAILTKLKRSAALTGNSVYEFSLRGKWPAERYQRVLELQIQLSNLLSHLTSVLEQMEPTWAQALLKRTRLSDVEFQGDVLAVISLIACSLRTGHPLPQITPCPLLGRFMEHQHGLSVVHPDSQEDFGLPKTTTEETLESLQYMNFCVGVSTAHGIVMRLDQLMLAVKELVGEHYHIDGLGLPLHYRRGRGVEMHTPVMTLTE